jgi:hypothetical protein
MVQTRLEVHLPMMRLVLGLVALHAWFGAFLYGCIGTLVDGSALCGETILDTISEGVCRRGTSNRPTRVRHRADGDSPPMIKLARRAYKGLE